MYHGGKPEARLQITKEKVEAAIGIRHKMGHMQWQDWQHTCSLMVGNSVSLETYFLCSK
jgi:hypothetical protein